MIDLIEGLCKVQIDCVHIGTAEETVQNVVPVLEKLGERGPQRAKTMLAIRKKVVVLQMLY